MGFPGGSVVKNPPVNTRDTGSIPGAGRFPWTRKWQPTSVFLPGESHGQKSLTGYSPWGCESVGQNLATKQQNNMRYKLFAAVVIIRTKLEEAHLIRGQTDSAVLQQKEGREGGKEGRSDGPPTCVTVGIIVLSPESGLAFCHLASPG